MLGYEWTNPFVISSAHSVEEPIPEQLHNPRQQIFPLQDRHSFELPGTLFSVSPPPVAVSPAAIVEDYSVLHYGLSLPPAPPEPPAGPAMRIGLNLGVRTYFASSPDGELVRLGTNVYRRSGGNTGAGGGGGLSSGLISPATSTARCQAEGCGADLTRAKHYHRRHKVCEFHSKAAAVIAHGLTQRFCQQCSRFHLLSEFDQGKRSCRKRLADHNRRRRKTQPPPALLAPPPQLQPACSVTAAAASITNPSNVTAAEPSAESASPRGGAAPTVASGQLVAPPSPTRMALGRTCFCNPEGVPGANFSSSSSSPSACSPSRSSSNSVLPHMADFGPYERRVPMSIWDTNADDE